MQLKISFFLQCERKDQRTNSLQRKLPEYSDMFNSNVRDLSLVFAEQVQNDLLILQKFLDRQNSLDVISD